MRGPRELNVFKHDALVEIIHMANETSRARQAVQIIMRVFGMWGRHCFVSLVEAIKKLESHQEQQNVVDCIKEVLKEDPPKKSFLERLSKSRSFAIMFIDRAISVLEPLDHIRSTVCMIFLSYNQYIENSEPNVEIRQVLQYIRDTDHQPDTLRKNMMGFNLNMFRYVMCLFLHVCNGW